MATSKKAVTKSSKLPHNLKPAVEESPVSLTVKLDRPTYRRLAVFATIGEKLRSHQEIMRTALVEYLDKHRG